MISHHEFAMSVEYHHHHDVNAPSRPKILIVGSGVGGLASAMSLCSRARVTVFEREERVGGVVDTTNACGSTPRELGPSHHLENHHRVRRLLAFGVPENPDVPFGSDRETIVCEDGTKKTPAEVAEIERDSLRKDSDRVLTKTCVPWGDETAALATGDDAESFVAGVVDASGQKRLTARLGYLETLKRAAKRMVNDHDVIFRFKQRVTAVNLSDDARGRRLVVRVASTEPDSVESIESIESFDVVIVAAPPSAARVITFPGGVRVPTDGQIVPVASARTFLCFKRTIDVPDGLRPAMIPGTHYVGDDGDIDGFRWAVVLSETELLLSYVDGARAERRLSRDAKTTTTTETLISKFLTFLKQKEITEGCVTTDQVLLNATVSVGGSLHAFHVGEAEPVVPEGVPVYFVGEAYGPPKLRAWMEGACARAEEITEKIWSYNV